jgi:D-alanine-D-alanine ligase
MSLPIPDLSNEKIAVLAGGSSCEREISLLSGKNVFEALSARGLKTVLIDAGSDLLSQLKRERVTAAFIALHGSFGEDGTVQRLLESAGIPYTGPGPQASELAFDKSRSQRLFSANGIRVPDFEVYADPKAVPVEPPMGYPVVVKPAKAGSSVGVSILRAPEGFAKAVESAFQYSDTILVDRFIQGRELTVGILGGQALPIVEIAAQRDFYDYEAKYGNAGTAYKVPAELSEEEAREVKRQALRAYRVLGCRMMSRVDLMLAEGKAYVLEVNTIPGLTSKSLLPKAAAQAGIDFPGLCVRILAMALTDRKAKEASWAAR